jgi:hypothetical protein
MKNTVKSGLGKSPIFDLTDEGAKIRIRRRGLIFLAIWLGLSGIASLLTIFNAEYPMHQFILVGMNLVKYIPLIMVAYSIARIRAARYLDDVYELKNEELASEFLEHAAFSRIEYITVYDKDKGKIVTKPNLSPLIAVKKGEITEKDEGSQLILIGGPGYIRVDLDSVALLEKPDGEPEVVYPRKDAWRLSSFERLREIGDSDVAGERKYAIINLREQIVRGISVKSRTKDGIPVEAHNIAIRFNILRGRGANRAAAQNIEIFSFNENAIQTLIYKQTIIAPESMVTSNAGFPWDTTIVPLVVSEIERLITSHTANEILASIGQKEMDIFLKAEQNAEQMRVDITGKQQAYTGEKKGTLSSVSLSRAMMTEHFLKPPFTDKAAALGVCLNWIDLGNWEPSGPIRDKIRNIWKIAAENIKKQGTVEKRKKQITDDETVRLIDTVAISFFNRITARSTSSGGEKQMSSKEVQELALKDPEFLSTYFMERYPQVEVSKKSPSGIAVEMLKAFRRELLAGQMLIKEKDKALEEEKRADLEKLKQILDGINACLPPSVPKKHV